MYLLHNLVKEKPKAPPNVVSNYNTIDELLRLPKDTVISFDGVYRNVWENREHLKDYDVYLFVVGDVIGKDNSFDKGMPREHYCTQSQLDDLVDMGCKLGWHTKTHRDLTTLTDDEVLEELKIPYPMNYFAYPYGRFNGRIEELVKQAGFLRAWSVTEFSKFSLKRQYLCQ